MSVTRTSTGHRRSAAWIFYLLVTFANLVYAMSGHPAALLGVLLAGLYTIYLFRGGRFVLWIF